jgi:thymidylate synthase ThyX
MREKFTETLNSLAKEEFLKLYRTEEYHDYDEPYFDLICKLQTFGRNADSVLNDLMSRSDKFLSTWAVAYGHNSLKDSCTDRFAVEDISILATKMIEWSMLSAFQEKSTRYADFSKVDFVPYMHVPGIDAKAPYAKAMSAYHEIFDNAFAHFQSTSDIENVNVRTRTARAQAFDIARYVLPVGIKTSVGITTPTRETEVILRELLSSHYSEAIDIGVGMLEAALKVNPSLVKHVKPTEYNRQVMPRFSDFAFKAGTDVSAESETIKAMSLASHYALPAEDHYTSSSNDVKMYVTDRSDFCHPIYVAAAKILKTATRTNPSIMNVASIIKQDDIAGVIIKSAFNGRGAHDAVPRELDTGSIIFEGYLDFGAYRDLQRHRYGKQSYIQPHTAYGHEIPDYVQNNKHLKDIYEDAFKAMDDANALASSNETSAHIAEYFTLLGHRVLFTYECTLAQAIYLIELRTGPAGHISYRRFAQDMAKCLLADMPELEGLIRVDWSEHTTRQKSEERTEQKLEALNKQ